MRILQKNYLFLLVAKENNSGGQIRRRVAEENS
jgi:hypothetical protein